MFVRIVKYEVPEEHFDEALDRLGEAAREIEQLDGFDHGYVVADRDEHLVSTITVWRNRSAMDTSDVRASAARQRAIRAVDGSVQCVDRLEVVAEMSAPVAAS